MFQWEETSPSLPYDWVSVHRLFFGSFLCLPYFIAAMPIRMCSWVLDFTHQNGSSNCVGVLFSKTVATKACFLIAKFSRLGVTSVCGWFKWICSFTWHETMPRLIWLAYYRIKTYNLLRLQLMYMSLDFWKLDISM